MPFPRWQGAFVLKYGRAFTPRPLPPKLKPGKLHLCFENCQRALIKNSDLVYCEGYAMQSGAPYPAHHSWLSTRDGFVVDLTWTAKRFSQKRAAVPLAAEYFGVPFQRMFVLAQYLRTQMCFGLLDGCDEWSLWKTCPSPDMFLEPLGTIRPLPLVPQRTNRKRKLRQE